MNRSVESQTIFVQSRFQLFSPMPEEKYAKLKDDIRLHGVQVPVEVDQNGQLLDGHHRIRAWTELRAEGFQVRDYTRLIRHFENDDDREFHAAKINTQRRDVSVEDKKRNAGTWLERGWSRRRVADALGESESTIRFWFPERSGAQRCAPEQPSSVEGMDGKQYPTTPHPDDLKMQAIELRRKGWTVRRVADALGVSVGSVTAWTKPTKATVATSAKQEKAARKAMESAQDGKDDDGADETVPDVQRRAKEARRQETEQRRTEDRHTASTIAETVVDDDRLMLLHGDAVEAGATIDDASVDVIICDPPYGTKHLDTYDKLGSLAARVLKPGGSVLAMAGQFTLIENLQSLSAHLSYHWTIAYLTPGGQSPQIWPRKVNTFWKPVLWFTKGNYTGEWHGDVIRSDANDNDKRFHHWGQSESGMARLVETFSKSNDVILDPFLGGGTTAVVTLDLGRRFVGIDVSEDAIQVTRDRLAKRRVPSCTKRAL